MNRKVAFKIKKSFVFRRDKFNQTLTTKHMDSDRENLNNSEVQNKARVTFIKEKPKKRVRNNHNRSVQISSRGKFLYFCQKSMYWGFCYTKIIFRW